MSYVDSKHPDACPHCGSTRSDEEYDELDAYAQDLLKKMVDANCEISKLEARIKLLDEGLSWWTNRSFSGRLIKRQEDRIKELEKSLAKMTNRAIANQLQD
jgi:transposase-like protein